MHRRPHSAQQPREAGTIIAPTFLTWEPQLREVTEVAPDHTVRKEEEPGTKHRSVPLTPWPNPTHTEPQFFHW